MIVLDTQHRGQRGDSLIEVMIALSLIAITTLGLIAGQTWFARSERMVLARERATLIADSVAEGIRRDEDRGPVVSQWRPRAASMLPQGDVDVFDQADSVRVAVVSWRADDSAEACAEPLAKPNSACVAVAFAR
jgi:prepilin-type N-terminal cleavage/methylation domain-containing protein